jgi:hypothetical protein
MFNKHTWIDEQRELLLESAQNGATYDDLQERLLKDIWKYIHIDTDRIYYSDCFDIIRELGFFNWTNCDVKNISQAAYYALYELACEEIDIDSILEEAGNE